MGEAFLAGDAVSSFDRKLLERGKRENPRKKERNVSLSRLVPSLYFFHSNVREYFYCFVLNLNYLDFVSYFEDDVKFRFPFTSVTDTIDMEIECDTLLLLFNFSYDSHIHERNEWRTFYVRDFVDK